MDDDKRKLTPRRLQKAGVGLPFYKAGPGLPRDRQPGDGLEQPPCFNTTRNGNTSHSGSRPDETRHFSECAASARPSRTCNAGPALARSSCSSAGEARSSGERSAGLEARTASLLWLRKTVGKANGAWRKGAGGAMGAKKSRALRDNPLPWASIDAYPEWIAALLSNYKRVAAASATADGACSCEERARAAPRARGDATANAAAHGADQVRRHVLW